MSVSDRSASGLSNRAEPPQGFGLPNLKSPTRAPTEVGVGIGRYRSAETPRRKADEGNTTRRLARRPLLGSVSGVCLMAPSQSRDDAAVLGRGLISQLHPRRLAGGWEEAGPPFYFQRHAKSPESSVRICSVTSRTAAVRLSVASRPSSQGDQAKSLQTAGAAS